MKDCTTAIGIKQQQAENDAELRAEKDPESRGELLSLKVELDRLLGNHYATCGKCRAKEAA